MREQIIREISIALGQRNDYFIRERDIQLYLANYFINSGLFDNVFIEYHVPSNLVNDYPWSDKNKIFIDIVLEKDEKFYPIEIKYKTTAQILPFLVFGQNVNVSLGDQSAKNIGCYDFWKDVKRIELITETFNLNDFGLVLFITNDSSYFVHPSPKVQYGPFSIHEGRQVLQKSFLNWDDSKKSISPEKALNFPGFKISKDYKINWQNLNLENHKYILV
jgi:hypothetical protein